MTLDQFRGLVRDKYEGIYPDEMSEDLNGHSVYISVEDLYYFAGPITTALKEVSDEQ